jgi:hypothetical protein
MVCGEISFAVLTRRSPLCAFGFCALKGTAFAVSAVDTQ